MEKPTILIVEDKKNVAEILNDYLLQADFNVSILIGSDAVISEVRLNPPDAILLDLDIPGKDSITICREIRIFSDVPILIISSKEEEIYRLLGLELGADDYICKPFSPREVVARLKAILRRKKKKKNRLVAGPITIEPDNYKATMGNVALFLTPIEFELLKIIMSQPGRVFTRNDLVSKIHGYDFKGNTRIIDTHIKNIRKKVDDFFPKKEIIQTIHGVGYRINIPNSMNIAA